MPKPRSESRANLALPPSGGTIQVAGREVTLTHLEKVLYPEAGFTKGEVLNYYRQIAPVLLPHLADRPLTLKRYPNGVDGEFFYEKRAPKYRPGWLKTAAVRGRRDPSEMIEYCLVNDLPSLLWIVNLADLELHTFLAKKQNLDKPTEIVFDLDPGSPADVTDCAEVALWTKEWLEKLGLQCWAKSSGSKGLQLYVPLNTPVTYELTKPFAKAMALGLEKTYPDRVVSDMKKALRSGKVLVDWSQNDPSKTTVCVYSLRAKARPFVSAPVTWEEVANCYRKDDPHLLFFEPQKVLQRVEKMGDLFADLLAVKQKITKQMLETIPKLGASASGAGKSNKTASSHGTELKTYNKKRNFRKTGEPAGALLSDSGSETMFVIQKHRASHLHYDFRLAAGGVLKSWAVPRSIPYLKGEKHLAVEVEDHPMSYARFEGIIPAGQYGGGTVMVWDIGTYRMLGGAPLQAWREGLLHLELEGKKLHGEWTLVRTKYSGSGKKQWLLLKSGSSVKPVTPKGDDRSALTGRTMAEIANDKNAKWDSNRGADASTRENSNPLPFESRSTKKSETKETDRRPGLLAKQFISPMKCLPKKEVPIGPGWIYEIKFDGYRALSICQSGAAVILSRNKKSFSERFSEIVRALGKLSVKSAILDGELVALDKNERASFQALQNYESGSAVAYYLFDMLELNGKNLMGLPLAERKRRLEELLKDAPPPLLFSANLSGTLQRIWQEIQRLRLEGVVAKRANSVYEPGMRSGQWVKVKAINQQEFVIGGYTAPAGSRIGFGALLVGVFDKGKLLYCGKVGTGFNRKLLTSLTAQMERLKTPKSPFPDLQQPQKLRGERGLSVAELRHCHWVEPKLVCEVQFTEWTQDGHLRHPSFQGLRDDIAPKEVHRERAT